MRLFPTHIAQRGWHYDVAPDGRFLINRVPESAAAPITLVQNWRPDARKQHRAE